MTGPDLTEFRKIFGYSQAQMADLFGVSVGLYGDWERGINHRTGKPLPIPRLVELACLAPATEFCGPPAKKRRKR